MPTVAADSESRRPTVRVSTFFLLAAALGFFLFAPQQVAATTSVLLNPIDGTVCDYTGQVGKENVCFGSPGDQLIFAIAIEVDATGINAWSVDLQWDAANQDQLTYNGGYEISPLSVANPSPPPTVLSYGVTPRDAAIQSTATSAGLLTRATEGVPPGADKYVASTSFRTGTVTFTLDGGDETYITAGFFRTDGASMGNTPTSAGGPGGFTTPNFGSWYVNTSSIPEPSTALLLTLGLWALARRRSRHPR